MKGFKFFILGALLLFLVIHTLCTVIYVLPQNFTPPFFYNKAKTYIAPVFNQSWNLFAPVPEINRTVFVSYCDKENKWTDWSDPFSHYQYEANANRLSVSEKMVLAKSSTLHYIYEENKEALAKKKMLAGNSGSGYFSVLKHMVQRELQSKNPEKIKVIVLFYNVKTKQKYFLYYPVFEPEK
ncbi:MAG TPA: hypothetical protein VNZ49_09915 [Bacteroidia bacterium]|jgi:hypothetical protein|nr:hypothetical protein [Bacteroidia bacterium]